MRNLFFLTILLVLLIRVVGAAQAGILGWTWLTLMTPQRLAWGFVADLPVNMAIAIATFFAWMVSHEQKKLRIDFAVVILLAFMALITLTTFFALAPELAWPRWDLAIKVMILGLMITAIMNTQVRIHALIWIITLSLGYYGVKGGIFTIVTGGHFRVLAPERSFGDNNFLAAALCTVLPLMNYLRLQSAHRGIRIGIAFSMGLTALGVLGTYSRGGLIGLAIMSAYIWWHSRNRTAILLLILIVAVPAYKFMPATWTERMGTIQTAGEDSSFQDRLGAWRTSLNLALARPFVGGGFNAIESPQVYRAYNGDPSFEGARAAHSIYFEVLGDHGFIGLVLYVALLLVTWRYAGTTRKMARNDPRYGWIEDLAAMIQVSLITFAVAGAALSMAYYDMFYLLLGITCVLRKMVFEPQNDLHLIGPSLPALISG